MEFGRVKNSTVFCLFRHALSVLPSFLKRRKGNSTLPRKRKKTLQTWDRDIVCLPKVKSADMHIAYPRGKYREQLGKNGLIGKVRLNSNMSMQDARSRAKFALCFSSR